MKRLEGPIQRAVVNYAKTEYNALCKKMESGIYGSTGWPDYGFFGWGRPAFFIEFKRPGGKLTPLQLHMKQQLEERGYRVYVCDDAVRGKQIVDKELGGKVATR